MSGWTRRWRGVVLALAAAAAFAGGQMVFGSDLQLYDFSWGAPAGDFSWGVLADFSWGAPSPDTSNVTVR